MTPTATTTPTREGWLLAGAELLWPRIVEKGGTKPANYRVSCGWPSSSPLMRASSLKRTLGEAWHAGSADEAREVFISPALDNPVEVLDVLLHELCHAALPGDAGHGPVFAALSKAVGLRKGKPTQARADDAMLDELAEMVKQLGPYPHKKLDRDPRPKQKARQMLVVCPDCGCKVRMARSWIDTYLPTCGCGASMVSEEYATQGEPLGLVQSHVEYRTADERFHLSTTKQGRMEGRWLVRELYRPLEGDDTASEPSDRWTYSVSRQDALAFIEAVRKGEADFPVHVAGEEVETDEEWLDEDDLDDVLGPVGDWTPREDDLFLGDEEEETPDNPDGSFDGDPEGEALFLDQAAKRDASGEQKSRSIVEAGGIGALD